MTTFQGRPASICRTAVGLLSVALCLTAEPALTNPADAGSTIRAALTSPLRTEADLAQDVSRQPVEFLTFAEIADGMTVAEINAGAGYLARLLPVMVGEDGTVYATNAGFVLELFDGINDRLTDSVAGYDNVHVSVQENDGIVLPEKLDVAILNNIYHDLHWQKVDVAAFNRSVFDALRPGGLFIVGDHSAKPGAGTSLVGEIHRIERKTVIEEIQAAGFELVETADFLANAADDRTAHVIDPEIRGKTDRFLLKFRRP